MWCHPSRGFRYRRPPFHGMALFGLLFIFGLMMWTGSFWWILFVFWFLKPFAFVSVWDDDAAEKRKRKNDDVITIQEKRKPRYIETVDGEWLEVIDEEPPRKV